MGMGGRECSRTRSQSQHGQLPRRDREGTYISELQLVFQDMARRLGTSSLAFVVLQGRGRSSGFKSIQVPVGVLRGHERVKQKRSGRLCTHSTPFVTL